MGDGSAGQPNDGAGVDGVRRVERRRNGGTPASPRDVLSELPAVVVLERFPVPTLAIARDGTILFANTAFASMVGYQPENVAGLAFSQLFHMDPAALSALSSVDALANMVVELRHSEGWTVRARMSKSALLRRDDPVTLVTFDNLTERLWGDER
ncbi:PAS domain-containing protein [Mycobacterium sp. 94-17]|uniref:PAS domain-containing protein n=1 Tax=Mycobacterium sp. 94-17 TaxID=2986147 RepID=UPI002D1F512B|nr:PAS domain-containing protein [Mycobacterium sp. 94-17]MEB4210090.1 PAS domain-containing protein [Mycobacterium sp. 94-17]